MNVQRLGATPANPLGVTINQAAAALKDYKAHRDVYDARDWEIERIYRQIAAGKTVISVHDAIRRAGRDERGRPRLAIMRADQRACDCWSGGGSDDQVIITNQHRSRGAAWHFAIKMPGQPGSPYLRSSALLPRIPPQHRPAAKTLTGYHLLWEADWTDVPHDPILLKRLGRDAWVVLAAWDLTAVELSVLRAD